MRSIDICEYSEAASKPKIAPYVVRSALEPGEMRLSSPFFCAKFVSAGGARYDAKRRHFVADPQRFLIAAPHSEFSLSLRRKARGICMFFDISGVGDMAAQMAAADLEGGSGPPLDFATASLPVNGSDLGRQLRTIAAGRDDHDVDMVTASFAALVLRLHKLERNLPCKQPKTARELIARLEIARTFLRDTTNRHVSLEEVEAVACLSRFHLSRSFAKAFGAPPLRYHQNLRLDMARQRILDGESPTTIAADLGFSSVASFSRAYLRRHDKRPTAEHQK